MNLMVDDLASYFVHVFLCCSRQWYWCFLNWKWPIVYLAERRELGALWRNRASEATLPFYLFFLKLMWIFCFNEEYFLPTFFFIDGQWAWPERSLKTPVSFPKRTVISHLQLQIFDFTMIFMILPREHPQWRCLLCLCCLWRVRGPGHS